jgi:hypothetical protein
MTDNRDHIFNVCRRALAWAKERDYTGYNKHDGLNSPLLWALSLDNRWLRMLFIQGVMRSPVNVRPFFGVRKVRNPKGMALFARAYLNLYRVTNEEFFRHEAESHPEGFRDFRGVTATPGRISASSPRRTSQTGS